MTITVYNFTSQLHVIHLYVELLVLYLSILSVVTTTVRRSAIVV